MNFWIKSAQVLLTVLMVFVAAYMIFLMLRTYQYPQVKPEIVDKWLESASKPEIQKYVNDYRAGFFALRHLLLQFAKVVFGYLLINSLLLIVEAMLKKKPQG